MRFYNRNDFQKLESVVSTVSNDVNVTGQISVQNMILGWQGTLSLKRGGTGTDLSTAGTGVFIRGAGGIVSIRALTAFDLPGAIVLTASTPPTSAGQLGLGTTTGFGNGSSGTAVTTTTKSTGTGPTAPQTIVGYLQMTLGGIPIWVPYCQ